MEGRVGGKKKKKTGRTKTCVTKTEKKEIDAKIYCRTRYLNKNFHGALLLLRHPRYKLKTPSQSLQHKYQNFLGKSYTKKNINTLSRLHELRNNLSHSNSSDNSKNSRSNSSSSGSARRRENVCLPQSFRRRRATATNTIS